MMIRRALLLVLLLGVGNAWGQACNYTVTPVLDFGTIAGLPTPQIDVSASITVECPALGSLLLRRVCISLPAGSGGISIADRRMVSGAFDVQYQLFRDAARTLVWGNVAGGQQRILEFPLLGGTQVATVYGRVFAAQTGKTVGLYQSVLSAIEAREGSTLQTCAAMSGVYSLPDTLTSQLQIEPNCSISASPLDFGTVTSVTQTDASSNLSVTCTLNGAYTVALDGGDNADINDRKMQLGPDTVDYQLYQDAARTQTWGDTPGTLVGGTGSGAAQSLTVYGRVPIQGAKPPGTYQDTITATVTF
ncbi:fimbrial major subunit CsuA/B family protein [Microbulbifer sp. SH-1]|uniref:Csu type fimbrial protein n=1 Tax=Microbulbifer sp. SH-1 TaxID=2681547 RepID=UPI00140E7602|nr:spore coat U domain-containing protein [Microbulbifer sp. SH-1]QIL89286.1 fimbrial major subunit CsuA/B family protein [Microbulbifer sp. SH-1]